MRYGPSCVVPLLVTAALALAGVQTVTGQAPAGEAVMAWPITIAPTWFDPSTAPPQITPFGMLYALHDAMVRPLPGQKMGNSLAESWTESSDGLTYEFKLRRGGEPPAYDPQKAKQLLAEAGYPRGFDAGDFTPLPGFWTVGEAAVNYLKAVGIRAKLRPTERAAFYAAWGEKKLRGLFLTAAGNAGNAATRVEAFIYSKGSYAYGGYPDIDELFQQQARERDPAKREAVLHRIQQLTIDRVMFAPIWNTRVLIGVGPRVSDHTINLVPLSIFPSYEDMRLKAQ